MHSHLVPFSFWSALLSIYGVHSHLVLIKVGNADSSSPPDKNVISLRFLEPPQIFGLLNYTLIEEDQTFRTACKVKGFPQDYFQTAFSLVLSRMILIGQAF